MIEWNPSHPGVVNARQVTNQFMMLVLVAPGALGPRSDPIRRIKPMVDSALAALSVEFLRERTVRRRGMAGAVVRWTTAEIAE